MAVPDPVPPFSLAGRHVRMTPLEAGDVDALLEAVTEDRSTYDFAALPWDRPTMEAYVHRALEQRAAGAHYPFVTWSIDAAQVVGSTRFYDLTRWDWEGVYPGSERQRRPGAIDAVNIGYTWLRPSAQRTPVNSEAKLLMLTHAFECWGTRAVRLKTDARNERSRAAIVRLGCTLDGVLRSERPAPDGTVRDSAYFSMLASEWPPNRARLRARLGW
ncbi:MAG: GNAT family N-acetyltransferase [Acidimicrobiales bacterium]|nr:GNAT family N-acetyltransferase [Acidimicrobiales bacterium]